MAYCGVVNPVGVAGTGLFVLLLGGGVVVVAVEPPPPPPPHPASREDEKAMAMAVSASLRFWAFFIARTSLLDFGAH